MKKMNWSLIITAIFLCSFGWPCQALRCRTEDGPGEDELKKISRICMKKVGENDSNSNDDSRGSNEENDRDYGETNNNNHHNKYNDNNQRNNYNVNGNYYNGQSGQNHSVGNRGSSFGQQPSRNSDGYQNWNNNGNGNSYGWNGNQSFGGARGFGNRANRRRDSNNSNQTEHDQACFVHCFFHELKLTNGDDQPDKFKMLTVLTRSIRDVELKQFLIDSIQECFHMVEHMDNYRRRNDKCDAAQSIANCLTERSKANCDDFADDVMIL